ncbi:hypothetical protein EIH07_10210 [Chryseobacterium taklimakanense]|uniref:hypothetical protein n=1 Tax=Chryseobacterium taklimakanense TaxID=536441 RepID=UPI000F5D59CF|nr:hypothetical protein [Chryseobacterium taklimakanense]AZI23383.1 hypothetical protein EIH07_10210 [Chryseobacterium taklimakanense]
MTIKERMVSPTPKFFRKVRNAALVMGAISSVILTAPVVLPASLVTIAGYLAVASGIAGALSQATITDREE